ncbi:MAG: hypothetical protein HYY16_19895 [Planctomycetes bacterium]|nr:hypothetical protein [Planctomycetota bacterium]
MKALLAALPLLCFAAPQDDDLLLRVLRDELDRSMQRLRMDGAPAPYYVEYAVEESVSFQVQASFGALAGQGETRHRILSVDLRVGDYSLDNTNFAGGNHYGSGGNAMLTVDDDYDALRHGLWLATDRAYKSAVEELEKKKAYLQENNVKDRPDDLSREEPFVLIQPTAGLDLDRERWTATARKLSGLFREYPSIQNGLVMFIAQAENRWFLNNEGSRHRVGRTELGMLVMAVAQADDGMKMSDYEMFVGRAEKDLPASEAMEKAVRALAERLTELTKAPPMEEYRGPVLFEDQASAEFFSQLLAPHVGNAHEPVGQSSPRGFGANPLKEKIGQRILPAFISVVDDPSARDHEGVPLLGGWDVDDDGVPPQKLTLVDKGMLKTFCMSRIPTRHVKRSNGHSRDGTGGAGTLFIRSESRRAASELKAQLIELGKEEGLPTVCIVRRMGNPLAAMLNPAGYFSMMRSGGGGMMLLPPVLLYRVNVENGREELARGAQFGKLTLRTLRDIEVTGDADRAHPTLRGMNSVGFIVTPSVLLKEIEIQKPGQETEKTPALKNPFFEK